MRTHFIELDVANVAATDGEEVDVSLYMHKWVQIFGTFTASLDIEVSLNSGADYVKLHTGITGPGLYEIAPTCTHLLIRTDTYTDGTPGAILGGMNARSN